MSKRNARGESQALDDGVSDFLHAGSLDSDSSVQEPSDDDNSEQRQSQDGALDDEELPLDPGSDSSEDERPSRNTVGEVPLHWYKDEEHIGYDVGGAKLIKRNRKDKLEALLDRNDSKKALRTIYDEYNDEEIVLSKQELEMILRIRKGQFPHVEVNPYEPYNDFFTRDVEQMPILDAPEPKRRFIPSKWEEKKIVKLVRALRKGWLKPSSEKKPAEEAPAYLLWADDGHANAERTGAGLTYIPPAKPKLPGHEESYNPPDEYLPAEEERAAWELMDPEDRPKVPPQKFNSLREVPAYARFIHDIFERCLDLYLAPRVRRKRLFINPATLRPSLPKPRDLQPFPTTLFVEYKGHSGKVRSLSPDPTGQWLASGGDDGIVRLWEVVTGRCVCRWAEGAPVSCVAWCPAASLSVVAIAVGHRLVIRAAPVGPRAAREAAAAAVQAAAAGGGDDSGVVTWQACVGGGVELTHAHPVTHVAWHCRGDYFSTTCPSGNTQSVLVHQLSKRSSQCPFRKNKGRVTRTLFHPTKPFFFVATDNHVRVYNLVAQSLAKKLVGGAGRLSCLAVHPGGDHVLLGSDDKRLAWYDLDLSTKPYKVLRYHTQALRGVSYHPTYPLFASAADDATVHVFHGMVYSDLLTNPLIVPVKILRGHKVHDHSGVLDCIFHPTQPWVFTAGADSAIYLFCN